MNLKARRAKKVSKDSIKLNAMQLAYKAQNSYTSGEYMQALEYWIRASEAAPKNHDYKVALCNALKHASFNQFHEKPKQIILELLKTKGLDHQNLSKPWLSLVMCDPKLKSIKDIYQQKDAVVEDIEHALKDPFFLYGIEKMMIFDVKFERALKVVLETVKDHKGFISAASHYNDLTEGLLYEADNVKYKTDPSIQTLSVPLNETSEDVRAQYENNPYPRWQSIDVSAPQKQDLNKTHRHLIAGCGTGFGACATALRYPNLNITAIDLSLASLSYAQKKAHELKIKNIEFYQADILDLDALEGEFDVIECSGVLHHMKDPLTGWICLKNKLKSGGRMHIGLYSELGRKDVVAAREFIAHKGYEATPKGIKQAREDIAELPTDHPARGVLNRRDFYSLSSCRDLLFHVQEHRFSVPQIKQALKELNLKFEGFDLHNPQVKQKYLAAFPNDPKMLNLENWKQFEVQYPDTFRGMYQFWCAS